MAIPPGLPVIARASFRCHRFRRARLSVGATAILVAAVGCQEEVTAPTLARGRAGDGHRGDCALSFEPGEPRALGPHLRRDHRQPGLLLGPQQLRRNSVTARPPSARRPVPVARHCVPLPPGERGRRQSTCGVTTAIEPTAGATAGMGHSGTAPAPSPDARSGRGRAPVSLGRCERLPRVRGELPGQQSLLLGL